MTKLISLFAAGLLSVAASGSAFAQMDGAPCTLGSANCVDTTGDGQSGTYMTPSTTTTTYTYDPDTGAQTGSTTTTNTTSSPSPTDY